MDIPLSKEQLMLANIALTKENEMLKQGVKRFVDKYYGGGSKANREDYGSMVNNKDISDLRELIKE